MDILMRINRMSAHPVEVEVMYNGETAKAMMPELEVEMYDETSGHGTFCARFRTQSDIAAARDAFIQGGLIKMSLVGVVEAIETTAEPAV